MYLIYNLKTFAQ